MILPQPLNGNGDDVVFIRFFRPRQNKEVLLNLAFITKIEIEYAIPSSDGRTLQMVSVDQGCQHAEAVRMYRAFHGGEEYLFEADPNNPVLKVFDDIYKQAIKS